MKNSKKKIAKCPCCSTDQHRTEIQICITILEKIEKQEFKHYKELQLEKYIYHRFIDSNFEWACDICISNKKSILASPGLQVAPWTPHLAYFDTPLKCYSCQNEFLFKKEEKKAWYESYKLPVNSKPDNCLICRREIRHQNFENKIISEILKKPENEISNNELNEVVKVFTAWEKIEKAMYYQSIINKRHKEQDQ